ncbi:MAG: peptidoglycan-binding domain-containing protein [Microcoleus sp.]
MPSPTSQFCIYEFSKKFDSIQPKNGIWVSGGFEIDKTKAFFRSNYQSGDISAIPDQIRQAVIDGLFEIPNAYPPNPLKNEEFLQKVVNGQLDIAAPPLEDIALIARELGDYCVLAVATRQMDNKDFRSKLVGYRYFWLKTSDLNPQRPDLVDGIATLLFWWIEQKTPCFDMNPSSYGHSHNKNTPYSHKKLFYKHQITQQYRPLPKIVNSNLPCLFEPTTDKQFDVWNLHAQALHLCNIMQKPAWAWNVRKLTKPETFTVVYCADRASYDQFFSPVLKSIEPAKPDKSRIETSGAQISLSNSAQSDILSVDHSPSSSDPPISPNQDASNLKKYLEHVGTNSKSTDLRLLIDLYKKNPPSKHRDLWFNYVNQELLLINNAKRCNFHVRNLTLVSVFIGDIKSKGQSSPQSTDNVNFTEEEKELAIGYLNELSIDISIYESLDAYNQTVRKLKQNIANLRKSLSGEDESPGGDGKGSSGWPHSIIKLFMDIANRHYKLLIISIIPVFFLSFVLLKINPLTLMINKISGVAPSPQEPRSSKDANQKYTVQQLQAARTFIEEKSVTKECGASSSSAQTQECKIYTQTKNKLPNWPVLPNPPANAVIPQGQTSAPKMLAKSRGKDNPVELVIFLQQSLKVAGAATIGALGVFDQTLENAVKEFQEKRTECELYTKDDNGNRIFDGQSGEKTWQCLSDYVQKKQVIAVLDYEIQSMSQRKSESEIQQHITQCKSQKAKPKDFLECVTGKELPK